MILKSETLGTYIRLSALDWSLTQQIDSEKLEIQEKEELINFFENLKNVEFPSIINQLKERFKMRIELDRKILSIIGFSKNEINEWLPKIYDAIVDELETMKKIK